MLQNWRLDLSSPLGNWSEIGATESRLIRYYRRESTRRRHASRVGARRLSQHNLILTFPSPEKVAPTGSQHIPQTNDFCRYSCD